MVELGKSERQHLQNRQWNGEEVIDKRKHLQVAGSFIYASLFTTHDRQTKHEIKLN